jgi:EmrB/QacA subfamily drug resistance transporter
MPSAPETRPVADPRRWLTLAVLVTTVVLVALDTSVLNVAIPTMLRELDTTVPALEWVIAGYSLTFAAMLIVGGRLGDVYGHRRLFVIGAALFGFGSLIASLATSVGWLILGEAVIEGLGAALMVPSTLAILSATFHGRERATAFAAWGAAAGAAVAFGPVLGGYLTTNHSWRWSFRINVILAPLAILGAMAFMRRGERAERVPIDLPGAALIASGMALVVFALSQGPTYGWFRPHEALTVGGVDVWPASMPVSAVVVALALGVVVLTTFVVVERSKERRGAHPLFALRLLGHRTFRYGLITSTIMSLGQLGVLFVVPIFLQGSRDLTAQENGLWLLPLGLAMICGAQISSRLHRRIGTTNVVRIGLFIEAAGFVALMPALNPDVTFLGLLPGLAVFGVGAGLASAQLTNVVLSGIPPDDSGVASGANSTSRQVGAALGAAVMGSLLTMQVTNQAVSSVRGEALPPGVADQAIEGLEALGANWRPDPSVGPEAAGTLNHLFDQALAGGTRWALLFAGAVVLAGAFLSLLIPQVEPPSPAVEYQPSGAVDPKAATDPAMAPRPSGGDDDDRPVVAPAH